MTPVKSDLKDHKKILLVCSPDDERYFTRFSSLVSGSSVPVFSGRIDTATEISRAAARLGADAIVTTREDYLKKLMPPGREKAAKIGNYAGSIIDSGVDGIEVLVVNPFAQLYSVPYGEWLTKRFLSKVLAPDTWRKTSEFRWAEVKTQTNYEEAKSHLSDCFLISIDIETAPPNMIRCISYCGFKTDGTSFSWVFPLDSLTKVDWMRELNALPAPKVCQNGKYECAHFFAYSAPMVNYIADTKNAMHSWFAELPKDLAFLTSLLVRDTMYWKDLAESGDKMDLYKYNALDTWGTGEAFISWLREAPPWAMRNYVTKFATVPIAHMCEMRGIKQDLPLVEKFAEEGEVIQDELLTDIRSMTAQPKFNPSSHLHVKKLLFVLGCGEKDKNTGRMGLPSSSDEKTLKSAILRHPLNEVILGKILEYRGERKLYSTYLPVGDKSKDFKGRVLYSLNPDGTDTGRFASKEHHFWTGLQIQNIPGSGSGIRVKQTMVADEGFVMFEADFAQAEARGVAYCSGDERLIAAVDSGQDFHSLNAAAFFGIPYEDIYDDKSGSTLDKLIRDLAKRVNHGANYNMGAAVLLDTMGEVNVRRAQKLLDLPKQWTLLDVCKYLLHRYEVTYPIVKTRYYNQITKQVMQTQKLVGATGWTRYCFGDPSSNKLHLNAYVAHVTQSLNAMILDIAFKRVFKWQLAEQNFHLLQVFAQIHDSLLFQVRIGHEHLAQKVGKLMTFAVPVTDSAGITRDLVVPVDVKSTGRRWGGPLKGEPKV